MLKDTDLVNYLFK